MSRASDQSGPVISFASRDWFSLRVDLISYIQGKFAAAWTDFNPSDVGTAIMETAVYVGDILSYYLDRRSMELYLRTARRRQSVIDIVRLIDYRLAGPIPATDQVVFDVDANITISEGFRVKASESDIDFFVTDDTPVTVNGGEKVPVTQGVQQNDPLGTAPLPQIKNWRLSLNFKKVWLESIEVTVGAVVATKVDEKVELDRNTLGYVVEVDEEGTVFIEFGNGEFGKLPDGGASVTADYVRTVGSGGAVGANKIDTLVDSHANIQSILSSDGSASGTDPESTELAKQKAPLTIGPAERAVSVEDHRGLAVKVSGVGKAEAIKGEKFNMITVHVAPVGGGLPSAALKQSVEQFFEDKIMVPTVLTVADPRYLDVDMSIDIHIPANIVLDKARTAVEKVISDFLAFASQDFGKDIHISEIYQEIQSAELNGEKIVRHAVVQGLTVDPIVVLPVGTSGNGTIESVSVDADKIMYETWTVTMTSTTEFKVTRKSTGQDEAATGTVDTPYTTDDGELTFTLVSGSDPEASGDLREIHTWPSRDDVIVDKMEIGREGDVTINPILFKDLPAS